MHPYIAAAGARVPAGSVWDWNGTGPFYSEGSQAAATTDAPGGPPEIPLIDTSSNFRGLVILDYNFLFLLPDFYQHEYVCESLCPCQRRMRFRLAGVSPRTSTSFINSYSFSDSGGISGIGNQKFQVKPMEILRYQSDTNRKLALPKMSNDTP